MSDKEFALLHFNATGNLDAGWILVDLSEGAILNSAQLEKLGYEWVSMRYIDAD